MKFLARCASSLFLLWLGGVHAAPLATPISAQKEIAPLGISCPQGLPEKVRCLAGVDSAGAHYLIAIPDRWNNVLVLHSHGGPLLGAPTSERVAEDLKRWKVVVRAGYAWAGSSFRQGGVAVRAAAEDTERLRQIFNHWVAAPRRTILHGQSWGASVAAMAADMFSSQSPLGLPYDGVLLTNGVLGGGTKSYDFRLDLRVVYQYVCNNHPLPTEPQYPLWMGLPKGATLNSAQLAERARECLGLGLSAGQRTPLQARNLKTIVDVIRIPERSVLGHLSWATFLFRDIALNRTNGRNVFGNQGVRYTGSADDDALNSGVARYGVDPEAVAIFANDTDPTGRISAPVLSASAIYDPTAFVELQDTFLRTMQKAGTADHLVQTFTSDDEHSYLSDPVYTALLALLLQWVDDGKKPTPKQVSDECAAQEVRFGTGCRFLPDFKPMPLESRVPARGYTPVQQERSNK